MLHVRRQGREILWYNDIPKEVNAYLDYDPDTFRGKTVLLPCDDPEWSKFTRFFAENFERLGLKKLISTSYAAASKKIGLYCKKSYNIRSTAQERKKSMTTGKALNGKPYAGNLHVRFDEGEVASCTAEASLRRVHCRRQPEAMTRPQVASRSEVARGLRASVCAATPRRGSLLYKKGFMRAVVAVGAMLWTCVALAADARPCARILFEPMPRLATTAFPA